MAEQYDSNPLAATLGSEGSAPDPVLDHQAIFSAPGAELVRHWWIESKRRWTEQNSASPGRLHASPAAGAVLTSSV